MARRTRGARLRVSLFGLGYVGAVTVACLARDGHTVTGVDVNADKVALVAAGQTPIVEPDLAELLARGVQSGRVAATSDPVEAVARTDVSLVCVGTPPLPSGTPDLTHVVNVCRQIGDAVRAKGKPHVVVLRSTVPPGTTSECSVLLKAAAAPASIAVAFNPEFLRKGSAIHDFDRPPYTVVGTDEPKAEEAVRTLYASVDADVVVVAARTAELLKWVANAWHATKIAFANEIGRIAKSSLVDGGELMALIARDVKLNSSAAYMRPGFAYGGSCLPKDVAALLAHAAGSGISVPLLEAVPTSNRAHVDAVGDLLLELRPSRVAILGLAFKRGTDDLRESPAVPLVKRLIGEGCAIRIYDRDVREAQLMGTNLAYIRANLPHFEALLASDAGSALADADTAVITYAAEEFLSAIRDAAAERSAPLPVIDAAGLLADPIKNVTVHGIAF